MSVVTIGTPRLTETDISSVIALAYKLMDEGLAGACIPVETEDGELMVAVLDTENKDLLYGFGRDRSGYYVFDTQSRPLAHGRYIEDVLKALPEAGAKPTKKRQQSKHPTAVADPLSNVNIYLMFHF